MRREILTYLLVFSKGIVESDECPETLRAFEAGAISRGDIEEFIDDFKAHSCK